MEYSRLVDVYAKLGSTSKRLEKIFIISELLKEVPSEEIGVISLLLQGRVFPTWDDRKIGVASKLILKAIALSAGVEQAKVEEAWKKTGDLGEAASAIFAKKKQATLFSAHLTVKKVFDNIVKVSAAEGHGSVDQKLGLIKELLTSAGPEEAKYIVRTVLEDLRVGVGDGSLRDAILWAFFGKELGIKFDSEKNDIGLEDREKYNKYSEAVQNAYNLSNDFAVVALAAKNKGLKGFDEISLQFGKPLKVMLYQKASGIENAFETVGKPAAVEYKYDGFRMQVHRKGEKIEIFTRRLEEVTPQFPEIARYVLDHINSKEFIIDCEAVGFSPKTGKYRPFQEISQRIKRKYDIAKLAEELPVELNIFDIVSYEGKNMLNEEFLKRRKILEKIVKEVPRKIVLAKQIITSDIHEAEKFYQESLKKGNEGIMVKNLAGIYKPGSRVGYGVKVKPVMETLDLVIVAAEWGTGKRGGWLSSFTLACIDDDGNFIEIGKVGTGIKEKPEEGTSFGQLTELLKPLIISEKGRDAKVKPSLVVEIEYEEIQKSPTYSSGYALRFPRLLRIREDRTPEEISTINDVEDLFYNQKKR